MERTLLSLLIILFYSSTLFAQFSSNEIDHLYQQITISKNNNYPDNELALYLDNITSAMASSNLSVEDRLKSHLIEANLYKFQGKMVQSLEAAKNGEEFAAQQKEYLWQARFLGFISTAYRELKMIQLGHETLVKAIKISEKANDSDELFRFRHNAYHEMAYQAESNQQTDEALDYIKQSIHWAKKIKSEKGLFSLAVDYQYVGILFNNLNQPDSAIYYFNQALQSIDHQEISINTQTLKNYVYTGMGKSYLLKKDFNASKDYFEIVLNDSLKYKTLGLNKELYSHLTDYYHSIADMNNFAVYRTKLDSISNLVDEGKNEAVNTITESLNSKNQYFQKRRYDFGLIFIGLLVILLAFTYYFLKKRSRNYTKKYQQLVERLQQENLQQKIRVNNEISRDKKQMDISPSQETENKILKKMEAFEKSEKFLRKDVTASYLSNEFDTNPKYLSQIIQKHREQNFNSYINHLRINYITHKLYNEPQYRQYKISYLAEECGFASTQVFVLAFKKENEIAPSQFIKELNKITA